MDYHFYQKQLINIQKLIYCSTFLLLSSLGNAEVKFHSDSVLVIDYISMKPVITKNEKIIRPIASITKLMTAMVVLDSNLSLDELITITTEDEDKIKNTGSRLYNYKSKKGKTLSRYYMLHLSLMSSDNYAASALSRNYPGGKNAFVAAMNTKAITLGMFNTHFEDPTGLTPLNTSTSEDLVKLLDTAKNYDLIRMFTSMGQVNYSFSNRDYLNPNRLILRESESSDNGWDIALSKTGFIQESGKCLVMLTSVNKKLYYMVFLNSPQVGYKNYTEEDATKIKQWLDKQQK